MFFGMGRKAKRKLANTQKGTNGVAMGSGRQVRSTAMRRLHTHNSSQEVKKEDRACGAFYRRELTMGRVRGGGSCGVLAECDWVARADRMWTWACARKVHLSASIFPAVLGRLALEPAGDLFPTPSHSLCPQT